MFKGMYPEFHELETGRILSPFELVKGNLYEMIVSDEWGLRRYSTQDLFRVVDIVEGIPDLTFVRRKGMTSSLTGEKLTEEHVQELSRALTKRFPDLGSHSLCLYPVSAEGKIGYEMGIIGVKWPTLELEEAAQEELMRINQEYGSKVESGRLQPLKVAGLSERELARLMGKEDHWESQFKVLPLYEKVIVR
jgi:hypothetical protein